MFIGIAGLSLGLLAGCGAKDKNDVNNVKTVNETTISGLVVQENGILETAHEGIEDDGGITYAYDWANNFCKYSDYYTYIIQYDYQGKELQKFSYKKFGMEDISEIEILEILDDKLLFSYYSYNSNAYDIYSVPIQHEDGKEVIKFDKKQKICKDILFSYYIYGNSSYFVLDAFESIIEVSQEKKEYREIDTGIEGISLTPISDKLIAREEDVVYFSGIAGEEYKGIFSYTLGSGIIKHITDKDTMNTIFTSCDGKLFYTATRPEDGGMCYDLIQYDNKSGENTVLATEEQITSKMPDKPTENSDIVRELCYKDGYVYMEVWAKQKPYVLSCNVATHELEFVKNLKFLVKHTEEKLEKPLSNANANYGNANDHNIFITVPGDYNYDILKEYTLQGEFVRNVYTHYFGNMWTLVYANNDELFFNVGDERGAAIYSVPLHFVDGNDFPVMDKAEKVVDVDGYYGCVWQGNFYADSGYLVYVSNNHNAEVYDRKRKKFIKIKNMPETCFSFITDSQHVALKHIDDCFVYATKPYGNGEDKYAFSYYKLGTDKLKFIDKRCYTSASKICDHKRKQVIYELYDEVWCYDMNNDKKKKLLDKKDIKAFYKSHNKKRDPMFDLYMDRDKLYIVDTVSECCASFDLEKGGKLQYEEVFSEMIKEKGDYWASDIQQAEGKFLIKLSDDHYYGCFQYRYYDPETNTGKELSENDKEILYFQLY